MRISWKWMALLGMLVMTGVAGTALRSHEQEQPMVQEWDAMDSSSDLELMDQDPYWAVGDVHYFEDPEDLTPSELNDGMSQPSSWDDPTLEIARMPAPDAVK